MTLKELKQTLESKKSYLKKGRQWLADNFGMTLDDVDKALKELKGETKTYRQSNSKLNYFREKLVLKPTKAAPKEITTSPIVKKASNNNTLIIGDLHEPFVLDGYLEHCIKTRDKFNCNKIVFIGDLLDNHAVSAHEHDPDGRSPYDEYELGIQRLKRWYTAFPVAKVCIGNHDARPMRRLFSSGLPSFWLKSLEQLLEAPKGYDFALHHEIDGVFYTHGTGVSGDAGAMKIASQNRQSAVIGHLHSVSNIKYSASYKDLIFAMTVGCGIDHKQYAFAYGKDNVAKPIISCGVVLGGSVPVLVPMEL
jgi:hypothetical protein